MNLSRRNFLHGMVATAGMYGLPSFAQSTDKPNLRIGILSDVHISWPNSPSVTEFIKALEWFKLRNVDGVIIAGDITDNGIDRQFKLVSDAWYQVFPDNKGNGGNHVEKIFQYGNHDVLGVQYLKNRYSEEKFKEFQAEDAALDRAGMWKKHFHEDYAQFYVKDVKGYKFIGANWGQGWGENKGADDFIKANAVKFDPSKPFFYAQHRHPKGTVYGDDAWSPDMGESTRALSLFPNAVAFSGHTHFPLTDERSIWQDTFTSVGTCSLRYVGTCPERANSWSESGEVLQMPKVKSDFHQGLLMDVHDDYVRLVRHELVRDESLGDDWVFPVMTKSNVKKTYSFAPRKEKAVAPEFAKDAKAKIVEIKEGKNRKKETLEQIAVEFPNAISNGSRVYEYEVVAYTKPYGYNRIMSVKRVYPNGYNANAKHLEKTVKCVFARNEFPPKMKIYFTVAPLDCWGNKGKTITTPRFKV